MVRLLIALLTLGAAWPAAAETNVVAQRAAEALGGIWRPVSGPISAAAITSACAGAREEMNGIEAALPRDLTPANLAELRPERGLLIVPADEAGFVYFFPPAGISWFASGLGIMTVLDEAQGLIGVQDALGRNVGLQLGHAGQHAVLRVRPPEGPLLTFVGCAQVG